MTYVTYMAYYQHLNKTRARAHLPGLDRYSIAVVWPLQIGDTDRQRVADVHGRAVHAGVPVWCGVVCVCVVVGGAGGRGTYRDTFVDTGTQTQADRQADRQTDRQTDARTHTPGGDFDSSGHLVGAERAHGHHKLAAKHTCTGTHTRVL
jgi:hypothetical protein